MNTEKRDDKEIIQSCDTNESSRSDDFYDEKRFYGDYHTHTVFSHGKGTIEANVLWALRRGLREIAITDHGFSHMTYNVRRRDLPTMRRQIEILAIKYPQIKVYLGVEANILSRRGDIDVRASDKPKLDIVVCGYHKLVWHSPRDGGYFWCNNLGCSGAKTVARNTDAYVNAVTRNEIDILSHPGNFCKCDVREVARACKAYGTYFELNGKRMYLTDGELEAAAKEGVTFICDSDAHTPRRVGDFGFGLQRARDLGIPSSQIANWGNAPVFRSRG